MEAAGTQRDGREADAFQRMLAFLNRNRSEEGLTSEEIQEERGRRYEEIRRKQIRLFLWKGSATPEELADRTFERLMEKVPGVDAGFVGDPAHYVASIGRLIFLESLRKPDVIELPPSAAEVSEDEERALECLERCLEQSLEPAEREMILEYYRGERKSKIDHRKEMAEQFGTSVNGLRLQSFRVRRRLRKCVMECMREK